MIGLILKIVVSPLSILFTDYFSEEINYPNIYSVIIVGLIIAFTGHLLELYTLRKGTLWISTAMDFTAATAIIYLSQLFIRGTMNTIGGALVTAVIICIFEVMLHYYLIKSGKTRKGLQ
jgi:uncharacterized membrane protein YvlD (DUF360 family)